MSRPAGTQKITARLIDLRRAAQGGDGARGNGSADQLARIEDTRRVDTGLDPAQRRQSCRAVEFGEDIALHLTDAMFGRQRTAEFDDMRIDQAADRGTMLGEPRGATYTPQDPMPPAQRVKVKLSDGKVRRIQHMASTMFYGADGKPMSASAFIEQLFGALPDLFKTEDELRQLWGDPLTRKRLMSELPFMATENIMMDAVKAGGDRQELHERIRELSMEAGKNVKVEGKDNNLLELIAADPSFNLSLDELKKTMDPKKYVGRAPKQVDEFLDEVVRPILKENADLLGVKAEINV